VDFVGGNGNRLWMYREEGRGLYYTFPFSNTVSSDKKDAKEELSF